MTMTLQDTAVAAFAIAGVVILARRIFRGLRSSTPGASCPNCASDTAACATPIQSAPAQTHER